MTRTLTLRRCDVSRRRWNASSAVDDALLHQDPFGLPDDVARGERVLPRLGLRLVGQPLERARERRRGVRPEQVADAQRLLSERAADVGVQGEDAGDRARDDETDADRASSCRRVGKMVEAWPALVVGQIGRDHHPAVGGARQWAAIQFELCAVEVGRPAGRARGCLQAPVVDQRHARRGTLGQGVDTRGKDQFELLIERRVGLQRGGQWGERCWRGDCFRTGRCPADVGSVRSMGLFDVSLDRRVSTRLSVVATLAALARPAGACPMTFLFVAFVEQVELCSACRDLLFPPIQHPLAGVGLALAPVCFGLTAVRPVVSTLIHGVGHLVVLVATDLHRAHVVALSGLVGKSLRVAQFQEPFIDRVHGHVVFRHRQRTARREVSRQLGG